MSPFLTHLLVGCFTAPQPCTIYPRRSSLDHSAIHRLFITFDREWMRILDCKQDQYVHECRTPATLIAVQRQSLRLADC